MKYLHLVFNYKFSFLISLVLGAHSISFAQSESEVKLTPFLILVESTDIGLKFTCPTGCAWTDLSFSLYEAETQRVNQYGMTNAEEDEAAHDERLANFHFEVRKDDKGIYFKGLRGTAWLELNFTSGNGKYHQYFDENGTRNMD